MATAMYLEHYLDSIENLPCELQRNFQLMRELDQRTEDKKAEIDILAAEYISTVKTLSPDQRVEHLQKIQSAYSKCKEYSDDKVQLAMQTYEMVDKHIRRLDADLARFEADLKDKMEGSDFESSGGRGLKKGRGQKEKRGSRGRGRRTSEEDTPKKKKHKGGSEFTDTILSVHPSDVLDMPVDPNEPTYCLCHQVSYGEMIGCDNPDVSVGAVHGPRAGPCTQGRGCGGAGGEGTWSPDCSSPLCLAVSYRVVSLRLRGSDHETQRKMVLSAVRSGEEEEEVRLLPGLEERVNVFLPSCCNIFSSF
uniref:Inhibitor of growth family member 5 n=1 Tax=Lynx canadensis TaxID=61383 RepID=A0A667HLZ0_LYNCA